ncbi:MAG: hypothetical protein WDN28_15460 [Chthoniobacter sp.]
MLAEGRFQGGLKFEPRVHAPEHVFGVWQVRAFDDERLRGGEAGDALGNACLDRAEAFQFRILRRELAAQGGDVVRLRVGRAIGSGTGEDQAQESEGDQFEIRFHTIGFSMGWVFTAGESKGAIRADANCGFCELPIAAAVPFATVLQRRFRRERGIDTPQTNVGHFWRFCVHGS